MKKSTIIVASILCGVGLLVCIVGAFAMGLDFSKLNTAKYDERIYEINEDFENIVINANVADVNFLVAKGENASVESYERADRKLSVYIKNGTLYIKENEKEWYDYIEFSFFAIGKKETIDVYLPRDKYNDLSVEIDTGDVNIPEYFAFDKIDIESDTGDIRIFAKAENISLLTDTGDILAEKLEVNNLSAETDTGRINIYNVNAKESLGVETDTGKVHIADVRAGVINAESNTGDMHFEHTEVSFKLSAISDTGDVHFALSDADTIYVRTSTGDVTGTLLSEKIFLTQTSTGKVRVPQGTSGGICEIKTSTGDIELALANY